MVSGIGLRAEAKECPGWPGLTLCDSAFITAFFRIQGLVYTGLAILRLESGSRCVFGSTCFPTTARGRVRLHWIHKASSLPTLRSCIAFALVKRLQRRSGLGGSS